MHRQATERQIKARITALEDEVRHLRRRSRLALMTALVGPTAIQVRRLLGVAEADRSDANFWALVAAVLTVAAVALAAWFRFTHAKLQAQLLTLELLRDAATGNPRDLP